MSNLPEQPIPKKRGRKPKAQADPVQPQPPSQTSTGVTQTTLAQYGMTTNASNNVMLVEETMEKAEPPVARKRGRKPKGGKVVAVTNISTDNNTHKVNVILHLKCSLKDLQTNGQGGTMEPYDAMGSAYGSVNIDQVTRSGHVTMNQTFPIAGTPINKIEDGLTDAASKHVVDSEPVCQQPAQCVEHKDIQSKLKQLETQLHYNFATDAKSACFWCTYTFDNPSIFIPKHYLKDAYQVYGCFCSPECGVAYLMNENLDSSTKFERYYLMNNIYGKIYNYTKNIKPAPDPHYTLDKFCGNLTIQEFRSMLSNERLYIVVDKPLTRIMPEIHQTNEDHIINSKMIPSNQNIKRPAKRNMNKNDILAENFGMGLSHA